MAKDSISREPAHGDARRMFDRIAHRYDLLNRLLSFRRDVAWRRKLVTCLPRNPGQRVLDLATGTGDVLLALHRKGGRARYALGLDVSHEMLRLGRRKLARAGLNGVFGMVHGDAMQLALADDSFDVVITAFGIRNMPAVKQVLEEIRRVLRPRGRLLVLEFSLPQSKLIRPIYMLYLRHILPRVGAVISGDPVAYRYLNRTVQEFSSGRAFNELMATAGFADVTAQPLTFGIATIYQGVNTTYEQ